MLGKIVQNIFALILPPVIVAFKKGGGLELVINLALTVLGFLPGVAHALWIVNANEDDELEEIYTSGSAAPGMNVSSLV